jgi:hypothetical protein
MANNITLTFEMGSGSISKTTRELTPDEVTLIRDYMWELHTQYEIVDEAPVELPRSNANDAEAIREWMSSFMRSLARDVGVFKDTRDAPAPTNIEL